ncbi:MAG TPA: type II secretion system F family protein, partial [Legionellaceae bacterium]|nr:type II secretion system F family protein [Legionellaceae bacterium]
MALTRLGEAQFGHIYAENRHLAKQKLHAQGFIIKTLTPVYRWVRSLKPDHITQFLYHLMTLLQTEVSLRQALHLLGACQMHPDLFTMVLTIQKDLASGLSFAETLRQYPKWFDGMLCHLIALGERSGTLALQLEQIVAHLQKKRVFSRQLIMILLYPCMVIIIALIVSLHLLLTIIPQFQHLFQNVH